MSGKVCKRCNELKPNSQYFNRNDRPGKYSTCKTCQRDLQAARRNKQKSYDYSLCPLMNKWGRSNENV